VQKMKGAREPSQGRTEQGSRNRFYTRCAILPAGTLLTARFRASGHATAAPPSAASNSRRPMVTVIRPSRARCVEGTIARRERTVLALHPAELRCGILIRPMSAVETTKVISRLHAVTLRPSPLRPSKQISAAIVFGYGH